MIEAVLFDMDGILCDSEPFWRQAEMEVFGRAGLTLTEQECAETTGLRIDEVVAFRYAQQPWASPSQAKVASEIVERVEALVSQRAQRLAGVESSLRFFEERGMKVGLASSSSSRLIATTLKALDLRERFRVTHSAENEPYGKPHPAVYLTACEKLGSEPTRTLAIEDSLNGVLSAKAARMTVIAVPADHDRGDPRFAIADLQLGSLEELDSRFSEVLSP